MHTKNEVLQQLAPRKTKGPDSIPWPRPRPNTYTEYSRRKEESKEIEGKGKGETGSSGESVVGREEGREKVQEGDESHDGREAKGSPHGCSVR